MGIDRYELTASCYGGGAMLHVEAKNSVGLCDGLTRRDFLRAGVLGAGSVGLTLTDLTRIQAASNRDLNCILLFLVGGPSQLDTWDPKPNAPDKVRGPFRPIRSNIPGIQLAETFPLMAKMADRFALIRSVHHDAAPIHETGHQLLQTGRLAQAGVEHPHFGSVVLALRGHRTADAPPFVVLPTPIAETGVNVGHGQGAGYLGVRHEPVVVRGDPTSAGLAAAVDAAHRACDASGDRSEADAVAFDPVFSGRAKQAFHLAEESVGVRDRYGPTTFGQSCLLARRLVEAGVRLVTVNMFETVFDNVTWDCHADGGALSTTLDDYRRMLCPMFDSAYTTLLDDLRQRGMLDTTLVLAMGEFGRTPQLNPRGGRDHWPGCWSVLFAGAGVRGGQVIGASDATGAEPSDRPVTPAELAASVYRGLGLEPATRLSGPDGSSFALADAAPVAELFNG
jgi:uncharacterized protein (DUF1501 family)